MAKTKHRVLSLVMALVMIFTLLPATAFAAELKPGEVEATKTATYDEDTGKAAITLSVKGEDVPGQSVSKPVDVVLVVDNSGSMEEEPHMGKCDGGPNDWVKKKVGHFLVDWNVYRCSKCGQYIKFGAIDPNDNTPILGWTYNGCNAEITKMNAAKNAAYTLIEDIYAANKENRIAIVSFESGIYYDGSIGLTKGDSTDNVQAVLNAVDKMRADGGTNYTAALKQAQTYLVSSTTNDKYVIFVSDGAPGQQGNSHNKPEWNGTKQAEELKTAGVKIYTIGMNLARGKDEDALETLASKPTAQYHKNLTNVSTMHDDLQNLIQKICAEITTADKPAGTNATFTDLIDTEKFTLDEQTVEGLTINTKTGEVKWDVGTITEQGASVSFTVTAKDDTYGYNIPTNRSATLEYTDSNGESKEKSVDNATVDIPSVTVTYKPGEHGTILSGDDPENYKVTVRKNADTPAAPDVKPDENYTFKEWSPRIADKATEDAEYTATWNAPAPVVKTISVSFLRENGTSIGLAQTCTSDAATSGVMPPTQDGDKTIYGWKDASGNAYTGGWSYADLEKLVTYWDNSNTGYLSFNADYTDPTPGPEFITVKFWLGNEPSASWADGTPATSAKIYTMYRKDKGTCTAPFATEIVSAPDRAFVKWDGLQENNASLNGGEAFTYDSMLTFIDEKNVVNLYAVYEDVEYNPDAGKQIVVTFSGCGNCEIMAGEGGTAVTNGYQYVLSGDDKTVDFKVPGVDAAEGYKYVNWVNDCSGSFQPWYADSRNGRLTWDSVKDIAGWDDNTGYVNIMAQCEEEIPVEKTYTVTFDSNGGNVVPAQPVKKGAKAVKPTDPTRSGYTFNGWYLNGVKYDFNTPVTGNITLVAKWTEDNNGSGGGGTTHTYTLKYETNGGKKIDSESKRSKWTKDYENLPVPTRSGYAFTGWYSDKKLTKLITDDVKVNTSVVTIYAGWRKSSVPAMLNGDDHFAYIQGYADGTVHPDNNITRAQVATIFFRLLDEDVRDDSLTTYNTFTDVSADYWANTAISTMSELGVIQGYSDGTFRPNAFITRAQFAAICARFDDTVKRGSSDFTDINGHWAKAEIERAATLGWIQGYSDGTFRPNNNITRAQAMTMINRVLCRLPEDEDDLLRGMNTWTDCNPGDWCYLAVQEATNSHDFQHRGVYESWTDLNRDPDWSKYEN